MVARHKIHLFSFSLTKTAHNLQVRNQLNAKWIIMFCPYIYK